MIRIRDGLPLYEAISTLGVLFSHLYNNSKKEVPCPILKSERARPSVVDKRDHLPALFLKIWRSPNSHARLETVTLTRVMGEKTTGAHHIAAIERRTISTNYTPKLSP